MMKPLDSPSAGEEMYQFNDSGWSDPVKHPINFLNPPQAAMWRTYVQTWESVLKETL